MNYPDEFQNLFEIETPLGFTVRVTRNYWDIITHIKHPVMANQLGEVKEALKYPCMIRRSRKDRQVYLFYKEKRLTRWTCAVVKRLNGDGFLITCYPTDAIKGGELLWQK